MSAPAMGLCLLIGPAHADERSLAEVAGSADSGGLVLREEPNESAAEVGRVPVGRWVFRDACRDVDRTAWCSVTYPVRGAVKSGWAERRFLGKVRQAADSGPRSTNRSEATNESMVREAREKLETLKRQEQSYMKQIVRAENIITAMIKQYGSFVSYTGVWENNFETEVEIERDGTLQLDTKRVQTNTESRAPGQLLAYWDTTFSQYARFSDLDDVSVDYNDNPDSAALKIACSESACAHFRSAGRETASKNINLIWIPISKQASKSWRDNLQEALNIRAEADRHAKITLQQIAKLTDALAKVNVP